MILNLKLATTFATIGALLAFSGSSCSFASAAEHSPTPSWINSSAQPIAPRAPSAEADHPPDSVRSAPGSDVSSPAAPNAAPAAVNQEAPQVAPQAAPQRAASNDIAPVSPAIAAGTSEIGPLAKSPFVHSEPRPVAPFPITLNDAVQNYVQNFVDQPEGLRLAFARSRPFLPEMIKMMKAQGIPDDLVYLTFAESDFSKRGKGPWQFTVGTASRYGLHVNRWIDERRDPILSTRAAAEYLAELHDQADNDWRVALVAWNTGAGNLERYWPLEGKNYDKFASLLPRRTRQLLNRFMAVAFIAHNASAYGIDDASYSDEPAWTIRNFKGGTLLKSIATEFETTVSKLRELNPALRIDRVPPNERTYGIRIPTDEDASN
jgi:membrane-bound lytic murein transglycosylase D